MVFDEIKNDSYEQIIYCHDPKVGLKAIIAVHSTVLGPAVGGCRMWHYHDENEALTDVLRLSKGMTYKAAVANLKWGGGKSVIIGDPHKDKTPELLHRFGEFVERLGGNYITAKDVGIGAEDLREIKTNTHHILGIEGESNSSGDPSPATAWGVYHGMKSAVKAGFGSESLKGIRVALQGLGSVSHSLLGHLVKEGAVVTGCDVEKEAIDRARNEYGIEIVSPEAIYDVDCDVFSPSALGAVINKETIPRIKAKVIAGAANNQLATEQDGKVLHEKGVIYAPDYVINGGGLINIYHEKMVQGGYNHDDAFKHVAEIHQTMDQIIDRSKRDNIPTFIIADHIAEERVEAGRK